MSLIRIKHPKGIVALITALGLAGCVGDEHGWIRSPAFGARFFPAAIDYWPEAGGLVFGDYGRGTVAVLPDSGGMPQTLLEIAAAARDRRVLRVRVDRAHGRLWVLTPRTAHVFDLRSRTTIARIAWPGAALSPLNCLPDLALDAQGNAYISDTTRPVLYRAGYLGHELRALHVRATGSPSATALAGLGFSALAPHPNGTDLLAGSAASGTLWRVSPQTGSAREIRLSKDLKGICGLAVRPRGRGARHPAERARLIATLGFSDRVAHVVLADPPADTQVVLCRHLPFLDTPTSVVYVPNMAVIATSHLRTHRTFNGARTWMPGPRWAYRMSRCNHDPG